MPIARILGKNGAQQTRIIEEKLKKKKKQVLQWQIKIVTCQNGMYVRVAIAWALKQMQRKK